MPNYNEGKKLQSRREILMRSLPKYVFHISGSYFIWQQLIGPQAANNSALMEKFHQKLKTLSPDEKYEFANLICIYGIDAALKMIPIPADDYGLNLKSISPRKFTDASTQISEPII